MLPAKTYQTPNAIDPGETPPSRPWRVLKAPSAEEVRNNAARLLQEAEISSPHSQRNLRSDRYLVSDRNLNAFVYDSDDAELHDQLPSVEDARLYAGRILKANPSMEAISLTDPTPLSRRMERMGIEPAQRSSKRFWCVVLAFLLGFTIILGLAIGLSKRKTKGSTDTATALTFPSASPIVVSGTVPNRFADTVNWIVEAGVSQEDSFENDVTPQYWAAKFIAEETFAVEIPTSMVGAESLLQRYILAVFYFALDGPEWEKEHKFLTSVHHCDWNTPLSGDNTYGIGATCNEKLEVNSLIIPDNGLHGIFPEELFLLTTLELIDIKRNLISGSIPNSFSKLTKLTFVDMRENRLTGGIPDWLGTSLSELQLCALSDNNLGGTIPESLGNASLLKSLALDGNNLKGDMRMINHLTNLEYLYLKNNEINDVVDDTFLADLERLVQLDISSNLLKGSFPVPLFHHKSLTTIDFHDNLLGGPFADDITVPANTQLEYLSLSANVITGTVPNAFELLMSLTHLDLTGNEMNGTIPSILGNMNQLVYLFMDVNPFTTGTLPSSFNRLTNLRELNLADTSLTGDVPTWLGGLSSLILLDLSDNKLVEGIPSELSKLSSLQYLLLNRNQLDGDVPSEILQLTGLTMLMLDLNNITGDLCLEANRIDFLGSDCKADDSGKVEIKCGCCKLCCNDNDPKSCRADYPLYADNYPGWERNYTKSPYAFSPEILNR